MDQSSTISRDTFIDYFFYDKHYRAKAKNVNEFIKLLFSAFDRNSDGSLSFQEFLVSKQLFESRSISDSLKFMFRLFDFTKDERIERPEIELFLQNLHKAMTITDGDGDEENDADKSSSEFAQSMMNDLDFNKNGSIDEDEFIEGFLKSEKYMNFIKTVFDFD